MDQAACELYGANYREFQASAAKDMQLNRMAVAKALNLPWNEMRDVSVTNTSGGWKTALVVGALSLAGLGGGAFIASQLMRPAETVIKETQLPGETIEKTIREKEGWKLEDGKVIPPAN